jgi:hypothetical protein
MSEMVTASIGWRWWVRWYLRAVVWFARVTGTEPNWQRVEWWIRRGLVARVKRRGRGRM